MSADTAPIVLPAANPYVGPRAFRRDERLPNRHRAARELADLLIAERVVLLHAPSGAGKTSLIQAAVARMLRADGFMPTPAARVDKPVSGGNRYVHSVGVDLLGAETPGLAELTIAEIVERVEPPLLDGSARVLVLDQIEEVLTLDPTDTDAKEEFFAQLGAALADGSLWALLAVREDYMGGFDRYLRYLPGRLRARYRLDYLDHSEALAAVRTPAEEQRVSFVDGADERLVDRLAKARVDMPGGAAEWLRSPYVEPFQLQVVCRTLWQAAAARSSENFRAIEPSDVDRVDIDRALSRYYGSTLAQLERDIGVDQRSVRDWFERDLVTSRRFRAQTTRAPVPGELGARVLDALEDAYLIRADTRAGTTWYELAHDRMINAVLDANQAWRAATLDPWQVAAYEWRRNQRQNAFLLTGDALRRAPLPAASGLADLEREFLSRSRDEAGLADARGATNRLALLAAAEAVVILVLVALLVLT